MGANPTQSPNASSFASQWNIGLSILPHDANGKENGRPVASLVALPLVLGNTEVVNVINLTTAPLPKWWCHQTMGHHMPLPSNCSVLETGHNLSFLLLLVLGYVFMKFKLWL